mgnify:CR=1 FL=1
MSLAIDIKFKFIIITDALGFIPDSITFRCQTIKVKRPTKKLIYIKNANDKPIEVIVR